MAMRSSGHVRQRSGDRMMDRRARSGSVERGQWRRASGGEHLVGGLSQGSYNGFKMAVAVIVFHFGVKMLVQFADILLPFIMALLLVTVLEPVKQVTLEVMECTLVLIFSKISFCRCCVRVSRKGSYGGGADERHGGRTEINELMKRVLLFMSIVITILLATRLFWLVGRIVWLSGEAVTQDFQYYQEGVQKRGGQVQLLLRRFHLEKKAQLDMQHMADLCLGLLKYVAEFLSQHVFYTVTQVSLTTIFVLFLLYSPVQRDFSPVMQGVFESMEVYLKLKTFISLMMGITNGIALAVIGLELPAAWGLLTFLANFIPNIGGPVMSILPCVIALLDVRKSFYQVSAAFLAQFFLHFNIANFVEPVVFGTTEEIHSVVVLLGLSFFGYIWGFTGMFLSVPLLFAIHAWLDTIARTAGYNQEAREDARFIMGMLEGRWLADSAEDGGEDAAGGGVSLLTGQIEASEGDIWTEQRRDRSPGPAARQGSGSVPAVGHQPSAGGQEVHKPLSDWEVTGRLKALFAVRDPQTEEVLLMGLLLRWVVLAGSYTIVFFGFAIFHWDLHSLIHPSGGERVPLPGEAVVDAATVLTTSAAPSEGVSTTAAIASMAKAVAAAAAAFPFEAPPKLNSRSSSEQQGTASSNDLQQQGSSSGSSSGSRSSRYAGSSNFFPARSNSSSELRNELGELGNVLGSSGGGSIERGSPRSSLRLRPARAPGFQSAAANASQGEAAASLNNNDSAQEYGASSWAGSE